MAYHITFVCFCGYQKTLRYGTFLSKCSQRFIDLIDVITSKNNHKVHNQYENLIEVFVKVYVGDL